MHDRLRAAVADADDEIEAIERKLLDRRGEERQVVAIVPLDAWQPLHERRVCPQTLDRRRNRTAHMDQREELGVGKPLAQRLERILAAAHAGQPIVNEGHLHRAVTGLPSASR